MEAALHTIELCLTALTEMRQLEVDGAKTTGVLGEAWLKAGRLAFGLALTWQRDAWGTIRTRAHIEDLAF